MGEEAEKAGDNGDKDGGNYLPSASAAASIHSLKISTAAVSSKARVSKMTRARVDWRKERKSEAKNKRDTQYYSQLKRANERW